MEEKPTGFSKMWCHKHHSTCHTSWESFCQLQETRLKVVPYVMQVLLGMVKMSFPPEAPLDELPDVLYGL